MAGPGEVVVTDTAKAIPLANSPIDGLPLTDLLVATETIGSEEFVVIKGYAVRPAQKGQKEMTIGGETVVEDPTPVCTGTFLVLDATTADALASAIASIAGTLLS